MSHRVNSNSKLCNLFDFCIMFSVDINLLKQRYRMDKYAASVNHCYLAASYERDGKFHCIANSA